MYLQMFVQQLLQQEELHKLRQKILHDISRGSHPEGFGKKAAHKTTQNSQENTCARVYFE